MFSLEQGLGLLPPLQERRLLWECLVVERQTHQLGGREYLDGSKGRGSQIRESKGRERVGTMEEKSY